MRISDANQHDSTVETLELLSKEKMGENRLTVLWKTHFVDRRVKASLADLVGNQNESLIRLLHKKTSGLTPGDIKYSLKRADMRIEFPSVNLASLSSILQPAKREKTPPLPRRRTKKKTLTPIPGTVKELIEVGLIQPPLGLEVSYKKTHLTATVQHDGTISFDGKTYTSLSVAGGMARNSVSGQPQDDRPYYQTNGWTFWKYRDPDTGKLEEIDRLRQLYVKRTR